jgi:hypothetical protein
MHYRAEAFAKEGTKTIEPLNPWIELVKRHKPSRLDIRAIELLYSC